MAARVWFTADTHFGHANIIRHSCRPFSSVEEHDRALISNWNGCVGPRDVVYFLGDFAYKNRDSAEGIRKRLNGTIYFVEGNHDSAAWQIRSMFAAWAQVHEMKFNVEGVGEGRIFLSHYAHRVWNKSHHGAWHLYGHSHNSLVEEETSLSFDVGVDAVAARLGGKPSGRAWSGLRREDYRPLSLEEVAEVMRGKKFVRVDHHGRGMACEGMGEI